MIKNEEALLNIFREICNKNDVTLHSNLEDMNLDSLDMLDVMARINKEFNIELSVDHFVQSKSIHALLEKINTELAI